MRVCLLTGASGRLGKAFCDARANDYRIVAIFRRNPPVVPSQSLSYFDPIAPELKHPDENPIHAVKADLTLESDRRRVVELALAKFGRIDLVINSAVHSVWAPMIESNRALDSAAAQFQINVIVPLQLTVLCARAFWRDRKAENLQENRNVINISSLAGSRVFSNRGQGVYAASKAALDHLSRHMADEMKDIGIRVNSLAPNTFDSIVPIRKVVETIRSLDRGQITGKVVVLDSDGETVK